SMCCCAATSWKNSRRSGDTSVNTTIAPASEALVSTSETASWSRTRVNSRTRTRWSGNCKRAARTTRSAVSPVESLTTKIVGRSIAAPPLTCASLTQRRRRYRQGLPLPREAPAELGTAHALHAAAVLGGVLGLEPVGLAAVLGARL